LWQTRNPISLTSPTKDNGRNKYFPLLNRSNGDANQTDSGEYAHSVSFERYRDEEDEGDNLIDIEMLDDVLLARAKRKLEREYLWSGWWTWCLDIFASNCCVRWNREDE
jgi:hypothetical protein